MEDWENKLKDFQKKIGYKFKTTTLLERALTTKNFALENNLTHNMHQEAFSVLGDAVQDVIVVEQSNHSGIHLKDELTNAKKTFAEDEAQRWIAVGISLHKFTRWGKGDLKQEVWLQTPSVLSRCLESLIGAVYLDGGIKAISEVFWHMYKNVHECNKEFYPISYMRLYYNRIFNISD